MTRLSNTFNGGIDGVAISAGNTGGTSGDSFDDVTVGGAGTITFNAATVVFGGLSAAINPDTSAVAYLGYTSLGTLTTVWGRVYVNFPDAPAANQQLVMVRDSITPGQCAGISVLTDGRIRLVDAAGATLANSTAVLSASSTARIEWKVVGHVSAGVVEAKIFLSPQSTTADETVTATAANTRGSFDRFRVGQTASAASNLGVFYLDEVAWDTVAYPGPATFTVTAPLIDQSGTIFNAKMRKHVSGFSIINQTGSLFAPSFTAKIGAGISFQANAFQANTFQTTPSFFIDQTGTLFAPSMPVLQQTITLPGPLEELAFQIDAYQTDTFQEYTGLDYTGTLFAPSAAVGGGAQFVLLTGTGGWDSPDILWDSTNTFWDQGLGGGIIVQTGHLFPLRVGTLIALDLIDQSGTLFAPSFNTQRVIVGLIDRTGVVFGPQFNQQVTLEILDYSQNLLDIFMRYAQEIDLDLIDQTGTLFEFQIGISQIELGIINSTGATFAPQANMQVSLDILDYANNVLNLQVSGAFVFAGLLDYTGTPYIMSIGVTPSTIDQTGTLYDLLVVNQIAQTVRLDDDISQFIDQTGELLDLEVEVAAPNTVVLGLINNTGHLFSIFVFVPVQPRILKRAEYLPTISKRGHYVPTIHKKGTFVT